MHHLNSEEVSSFWEFEQRRFPRGQRTLLIKDIFHEFVEPKLVAEREDWDNLSYDRYYLNASAGFSYESWEIDRAHYDGELTELEQRAHLSFEDCGRMCASKDECFQYRYQNGICGYARAFMLGKPMKREWEERRRWRSGWDLEKIRNWVAAHRECKEIYWPDV